MARSRAANPLLDTALTAYTPGETLELLRHPTVRRWHAMMRLVRLPRHYRTIILVPCAKTKPWEGPAVARSKLYSACNALRAIHPDACFVTVSEPLGIVPMQRWGDFPQYDNPGLFRDDALRSGLTSAAWRATPFRRKLVLPFDDEAWRDCIDILGGVVGDFLAHHRGRRIIAAVDSAAGPQSTHAAMLDVAIARSGVQVERHPKRDLPRVSPLGYLEGLLAA